MIISKAQVLRYLKQEMMYTATMPPRKQTNENLLLVLEVVERRHNNLHFRTAINGICGDYASGVFGGGIMGCIRCCCAPIGSSALAVWKASQ